MNAWWFVKCKSFDLTCEHLFLLVRPATWSQPKVASFWDELRPSRYLHPLLFCRPCGSSTRMRSTRQVGSHDGGFFQLQLLLDNGFVVMWFLHEGWNVTRRTDYLRISGNHWRSLDLVFLKLCEDHQSNKTAKSLCSKNAALWHKQWKVPCFCFFKEGSRWWTLLHWAMPGHYSSQVRAHARREGRRKALLVGR